MGGDDGGAPPPHYLSGAVMSAEPLRRIALPRVDLKRSACSTTARRGSARRPPPRARAGRRARRGSPENATISPTTTSGIVSMIRGGAPAPGGAAKSAEWSGREHRKGHSWSSIESRWRDARARSIGYHDSVVVRWRYPLPKLRAVEHKIDQREVFFMKLFAVAASRRLMPLTPARAEERSSSSATSSLPTPRAKGAERFKGAGRNIRPADSKSGSTRTRSSTRTRKLRARSSSAPCRCSPLALAMFGPLGIRTSRFDLPYMFADRATRSGDRPGPDQRSRSPAFSNPKGITGCCYGTASRS